MAKIRFREGDWRVYQGRHNDYYQIYPVFAWAFVVYLRALLEERKTRTRHKHR